MEELLFLQFSQCAGLCNRFAADISDIASVELSVLHIMHLLTYSQQKSLEQALWSELNEQNTDELTVQIVIKVYSEIYSDSGFPVGSVVKYPPANAGATGDSSSIPGSGRFPGGGFGNPLQYSCLENPMDRED